MLMVVKVSTSSLQRYSTVARGGSSVEGCIVHSCRLCTCYWAYIVAADPRHLLLPVVEWTDVGPFRVPLAVPRRTPF